MVYIPAHSRTGLPFSDLPGAEHTRCTADHRRMPFRLRMLHALVASPELTGRRLRAIEYLLLHACTHVPSGIRQRTLRAETEIDRVLAGLPLVPSGQTPEPAVQLYRSLCDEVLSTRSFGELLAGDVLRRTRAVKYALGERFLHPCVLKAALHCLILIERLVDAPGYSDPRELRLRGWLRHRLPFEATPVGVRGGANPAVGAQSQRIAPDVVVTPHMAAGEAHESDHHVTEADPHLMDESPTFSGHVRQRRVVRPREGHRATRRSPPRRAEHTPQRPSGILAMCVALLRAFITFLISGGRGNPPGPTESPRRPGTRMPPHRPDHTSCLKSTVAVG